MSNKNKKLTGIVYSTDSNFSYQKHHESGPETLPESKQQLKIFFEKRAGKDTLIIKNFIGKTEDLEALGKWLKTQCGAGGSVKDGVILIQGKMREKIVLLLQQKGFKVK
jgi:translation initiation factor 1